MNQAILGVLLLSLIGLCDLYFGQSWVSAPLKLGCDSPCVASIGDMGVT